MPELQLDGLVGPSHNYAGLSLGNLAAARNAGETSSPRRAALQGIRKMRLVLGLGVPQGLLLPHRRPDDAMLERLGFRDRRHAAAEDRTLYASVFSASAMWAANAATVSPAPDTADGRTHLTVANLVTMPHRSIEWRQTLAQLKLAFADRRFFAVHGPVPSTFGDEGAANHMRLAPDHGAPGAEVFVYGIRRGGAFPARQHPRASAAVARVHGVREPLFAVQADAAIQAGAFHNDVVAVANGPLLFCHEQAFEDRDALIESLAARVPGFTLVEAPAADVPLADAISSYVFNAALLTVADGMALILPAEAQENAAVWRWLQKVAADPANPIRHLHVLDLRESMRNGGGPACLRLRVQLSEEALAAVDARFLVDARKLDRLERLVEDYWPAEIPEADIGSQELAEACERAHAALLDFLGIDEI